VGGTGSCGGAGQSAGVLVAQLVEDQFDEFPGGGELADAGSAARTDVVAELPEVAMLVGTSSSATRQSGRGV
jgi:hypothetical protein